MNEMNYRIGTCLFAAAQAIAAQAQNASTNQVQQLPGMVVIGEAASQEIVQGPFLPETVGTKIYSGKKTSVVDFDAMPQIQSDNYRQAFSQTPGLLVTELPNPSLLSLGSRGVGDPHETQNLLVLKDGIPFVADLFGYPTVYYAPPFESIDRLEYVRGGSSLLYGPQPGGSLNYVTHRPRTDREWSVYAQQIFGSDDLFSTFARVDGTVGRLGYLADFSRRAGDSFRDTNGDFQTLGGTLKVVLDAQSDQRWIFNMDSFSADSGEPGGLALTSGVAGNVNYYDNRNATQTAFDRVRVERYLPSLIYERDFGQASTIAATGYGGYFGRFSKRQTGGGFGTVRTDNANLIQLQEFYTFGTDARLRTDWFAWSESHTLTAGFSTFYSDSPYTVKRGASANAEDGELRQWFERESIYGAIFAENRFAFGKFSATPAFRLENIHQSIDERLNRGTGAAAAVDPSNSDASDTEVVPLVGIGLAYDLPAKSQVYANVSQGYKAQMYAETVPVGPADSVSGNLDPGKTWSYELGLRGSPADWVNFDTSAFLIDYDNRFGSVPSGGGVIFQNVGRSITKGVDVATSIDLVGLTDALNDTAYRERFGSFSLYGNVEFLDSEFVSSDLLAIRDKETQYAPDYLIRFGGIYRWREKAKLALMGTIVDDHFANDANTANFRVPAYMVWDLTFEAKVYKDNVSVIAGINNLFDESYYSRIRSGGIDPANGRNFYAGVAFAF